MALPTIKPTAYTHTLNGLNRTIQFRCFTNAEQKTLLEAKEEQDRTMIYNNIKNVVGACIMDDVDVNDLTLYDFEDIFMRIRAKSVDQYIQGELKVPYYPTPKSKKTEEHTHAFNINIDDIKVVIPEDMPSKYIRLTENYTLEMTHPTVGSSTKPFKDNDEFIIEHMVCTFSDDGEDVAYIKDESKEDVQAFYDSIETPVLLNMTEFMNTQPYLYYKMDIELPNGNPHTIEFTSIEDFFT